MSPGVRASPIDRPNSTPLIIISVFNNHQPYKTPLIRQPLRFAASPRYAPAVLVGCMLSLSMAIGSLAEQTGTAARVFTIVSALRGPLSAAHTSSTDVEFHAPPPMWGRTHLRLRHPSAPRCVTGFRLARTCNTQSTQRCTFPRTREHTTVVSTLNGEVGSTHAPLLTLTSRDAERESPCPTTQ
jgi:hypothetical protein